MAQRFVSDAPTIRTFVREKELQLLVVMEGVGGQFIRRLQAVA